MALLFDIEYLENGAVFLVGYILSRAVGRLIFLIVDQSRLKKINHD